MKIHNRRLSRGDRFLLVCMASMILVFVISLAGTVRYSLLWKETERADGGLAGFDEEERP